MSEEKGEYLVKSATNEDIVREIFQKLSNIDVSAYTQKKNNLTYLPWADAYRLLITEYPDAEIKEYWFQGEDNRAHPYFRDETGHYVVVGVTIHGIEKTEKLPVLDYRNKPIEAPKSFDINTSTKRCWVKAMALWGLGLYIYAGEDIPITPSVSRKPISEKQDLSASPRQADDQPISEKQKSEMEFLLAEKGYSITECEEKLTEKFAGKLKERPVKIDFSQMTAKKAAWLIKEIATL